MQSRWLLIGLIVSVTLNLFLIGAGAGVFALGLKMAHQPAVKRPGELVRATRDLPLDQRRAMRQMLRAAWTEVSPDVQKSRALRLDAWTSLAEAKPDAAATKLKLAQARQLDIANRAKVEERVVDYALALPPTGRVVFSQGMQRVLARPAAAAPAAKGP